MLRAAHIHPHEIERNAMSARQQLDEIRRRQLERECTPPARCAVCRKAFATGRSVARFNYAGSSVTLCCPLCAEVFETNPTAYVCRIDALTWMRTQHVCRWAWG